MGLPTLNGFIGEIMILQGAFSVNKVWAYWAVLGIILGAAYLLWLYQRVFWGEVKHDENRKLIDLNARELATILPLAFLCFWIGLYPKPFMKITDTSLNHLVETVDRNSRKAAFHTQPADDSLEVRTGIRQKAEPPLAELAGQTSDG